MYDVFKIVNWLRVKNNADMKRDENIEELKRFFEIYLPVTEENAETLWRLCNEKLQQKDFTRRALIAHSNVEIVCTTDDPVDDLHYHHQLSQTEAIK